MQTRKGRGKQKAFSEFYPCISFEKQIGAAPGIKERNRSTWARRRAERTEAPPGWDVKAMEQYTRTAGVKLKNAKYSEIVDVDGIKIKIKNGLMT